MKERWNQISRSSFQLLCCGILLLIAPNSSAQKTELIVKNFESKEPIIAATVVHKGKPIAKTNGEGKVNIPMDYRVVWIYAMGFDTAEVVLGSQQQIIYLEKNETKLKEVVVKPWIDDRANYLVKKMIENAEVNHPDRLPSYRFYTYSKLTADAKEDTASNKSKKIDTAELKENAAYFQKNKLFVWERATVFKHDSRYGTKKVLLNSNMSGFKTPLYEMLALTMDEVNTLPRMFKSDAYKDYYFRIEDSSVLDGRKIMQVAFYPLKKSKNKRKRHGYVRIESENHGCIGYKGTTKQGFYELNNQIVAGKVFTKDMYIHTTNTMIEVADYNTHMIYQLKVHDIESPAIIDKKELGGYDSEISPRLNDTNSKTLLNTLRGADTIDSREVNTFHSLDTLIKKEGLENKLRLLLALRNGYIKLGKVNLDILELMQYNKHEGFRINLAGETNYQFHPKISLYGKLGYGFGDQQLKYTAGIGYLLNYQHQSKLLLHYQNEVLPVGRPSFDLVSKMDRFNHLVNIWFFDKFYHTKGFHLAYQSDLHKYVEQKTSISYEQIGVLFPYQFQGKDITNMQMASTRIEARYYPKTKYIVTPEGKFKVQNKPTQFQFTYQYRHPLNTEIKPYHTIELEVKSKLKSILGISEWSATAASTAGRAPMMGLFEGLGSSNRNSRLLTTFGLGSYRFFETMQPTTFYSDRYGTLFVKHHLPKIPTSNSYSLSLSIVYKALVGELAHKEDHSLPLTAPTKIYQEAGLEWDDIFKKIPIGIGLYYRMGAYHIGDFSDNFATRILIEL